jgi:hypothetical protein
LLLAVGVQFKIGVKVDFTELVICVQTPKGGEGAYGLLRRDHSRPSEKCV